MERSYASASIVARSRAHLRGAGESYLRHLRFAANVAALMIAAGLACLLHALVPGLFPDKASRAVRRLNAAFENRAEAEARLETRDDAGGLLTLLVLSILTALFPWIGNADIAISSSLSLLALFMPVAALRGISRPEDDEAEAEAPAWTRLWGGKPAGISARPAVEQIVIIGAGFSGTMLAVQLARRGGVDVTLVERRPEPARGIAYATDNPNHLLNVRAAKMSAFPDDAGHFAAWLAERRLGGPFDFAPRRSYGAYLDELLAGARAMAGTGLEIVQGEAIDLDFDGGGTRVILAGGRRLAAGRVVLATGNLPPADPPVLADAALAPDLYARKPWASDIANGLDSDDTILLLGTGLTAIDAIVALTDAGFQGRIIAASRHGLLPRSHEDGPTAPPACHHQLGAPLTRLLRAVRARAETIGWRTAVDELRPDTAALWQAATPAERARFLRHLRPWWDVHRHRVPPAIADRISGLRARGQLRLVAGTLVQAGAGDKGARVRLRIRRTSYCETIDVRRIVNCTGPSFNLQQTEDPLLRNMLRRGYVKPDAHQLGIETGLWGEAIDAHGAPNSSLLAIGPLTRGATWEMTAVPELRAQAAEMARLLAETTALRARA